MIYRPDALENTRKIQTKVLIHSFGRSHRNRSSKIVDIIYKPRRFYFQRWFTSKLEVMQMQ